MDYKIVPLEEKHRDQWVVAFKEYLDFIEVVSNEQRIENSWKVLCDDNIINGGFAAVHDGKLMGFVHYSFVMCIINGLYVCNLNGTYVFPEYRKFGVCSKLYEALEEKCKENSIPAFRVLVHKGNNPMNKFVSKISRDLGFRQYQRDIDLSHLTD